MSYGSSAKKMLAGFLSMMTLMWALGVSVLLPTGQVQAGYLSYASDTLSSSKITTGANHEIIFSVAGEVTASSTIKVDFPTGAGQFSGVGSLGTGDYDIATSSSSGGAYTELTLVPEGSCPSSGTTRFSVTDNGDTAIFTHCNGTDALAASSSVRVRIGTNAVGGTGQLTNPTSAGTYEIALLTEQEGGADIDSGEITVAIVDQVTTSASVDSNLSFAVNAVLSNIDFVGLDGGSEVTDAASTDATLPFPELPSGGASREVAQVLTTTTNARNGYSVAVYTNQNPTSTKYPEATIAPFKNGSSITSTTATWAAPTGTFSDRLTWGHWGVTSTDQTITGGPTYTRTNGAETYAAIATSTAGTKVGYNGGVTKGVALGDAGYVGVIYRIQVSDYQEAATDYTNTLTYVVTPIF